MSPKEYEKAVIDKLLGKYHERVAKGIKTNRRISAKPKDFYKEYADNNADMEEKDRFHQAIAALERRQVVTAEFEKNGNMLSTDMKAVYLREDKIDVLYEYLETEYGMIPNSKLIPAVRRLFDQYDSDGELVSYYRSSMFSQMGDPGSKLDPDRIGANLRMLHFMESNQESLYVREASMLVYGESKWFEEHNYDEVCTLTRAALDMPKQEGERNDAILAKYWITPPEQEIFIKGGWSIEWSGHGLETAGLKGGIAIASSDIPDIRKITIHSAYLMTIENKTSYQRMSGDQIAVMYLGGFASRHQILFLQKVIHDNPNTGRLHFGDVDVGGFLIHRHLCRATGTDFALYCMGVEQLRDERFQTCLQPLTDSDRNRLEPLLEEEPYRQTAEYMKEHQVKLEQEIVSYYLSKTACAIAAGCRG